MVKRSPLWAAEKRVWRRGPPWNLFRDRQRLRKQDEDAAKYDPAFFESPKRKNRYPYYSYRKGRPDRRLAAFGTALFPSWRNAKYDPDWVNPVYRLLFEGRKRLGGAEGAHAYWPLVAYNPAYRNRIYYKGKRRPIVVEEKPKRRKFY